MRISDWSSDVCSSDLLHAGQAVDLAEQARKLAEILHPHLQVQPLLPVAPAVAADRQHVRILLRDQVGQVLEQVFAVDGIDDHCGLVPATGTDRKSTRLNSSP